MEQRELDTKKNDKGFTLIELLIVIVILGILATVTVIAVNGITSRAESNACATEVATVETAVEAYFANEGVSALPAAIPNTSTGLGALANYLKKTTDAAIAVAYTGVVTPPTGCTAT